MNAPVDISELKTIKDYDELSEWTEDLRVRTKHGSEWSDVVRWMCLNDLYYLHRYVLSFGTMPHQPTGIPVLANDIYIAMARATEYHVAQGRGIMASGRRSGKSEMRTCALPIQMALKYPDISQTIFSVEKAYAQRHLRRIKTELEANKLLLWLWSDVLWTDPQEQAKSASITWSVADGLVVKGRKVNRSTSTIAADALFGGGVIGSGYDVIYLDDCERRDKVQTQAAVEDLERAISEAISLLTPIVLPKPCAIISNTRMSTIGVIHRKCEEWSVEDPKLVFEVPSEIIEEKHSDCVRFCYNDEVGPMGGRVTWPNTASYLKHKYDMSPDPEEYILQHCLSYKTVSERTLNEDLIHYYDDLPSEVGRGTNVYICIDPSKGKHDPAAIWVWGLSHDRRKIWLDGNISKLDVTTQPFHDEVFRLVSKWTNLAARVVEVRVEDVPNSDWAALVERELRMRGAWVTVRKVRIGANMVAKKFATGKADREYAAWSPMLHRGEVWFPRPVSKGGRGILCDIDRTGNDYKDIVDVFLSVEFRPFPRCKHDDGLDAGGLIEDEKTNQDAPLQYPESTESREWQSRQLSRRIYGTSGPSWMSAG